ncbi:MAG: isocitrate lyase/PEP mutase family protein [Rhizobiaceae bacterium]
MNQMNDTANIEDESFTLRQRLAAGKFISAPGVFDLISARIADRMGFDALYMTGYGTVASYLGLPDAGLATYTDMLDRVARIVEMTNTPLIADGDTGYGGLLNVRHTVRGYEGAGAKAIQLEDQQFPKKCGHTPGRRVIPMKDAVRKIEVAAESRRSDDFLIIARTDARTSLGIDEAIARAKAFEAAGADLIFVESPESEDELQKVGDAIGKPLVANMVEGGSTPILSRERLKELGFSLAIFPTMGFLAAGAALQSAYAHLRQTGSSKDTNVPLYPFDEFSRLMGFPEIWNFEAQHMEVD